MATPARYFDLVREMKYAYNHRLRLVESAKQRGLKPTARLFATTVPTVRKWLRRFQQHDPSGWVAFRRAHRHQSLKTSPTTEATRCSGPSPTNAALLPAPSSPPASSSIWIATAFRCAIWSGKLTNCGEVKGGLS